MEPVITAVLTLVGVLASNSRSRAVIEVKLDTLAAKVEKLNSMIERTYALEQDTAVPKCDVEAMGKAACSARLRAGWPPRAIFSTDAQG